MENLELIKNKLKKLRGKNNERVNRAFSFRGFEAEIINDFLNENDITLGKLIMILAKKHGIINDEIVEVVKEELHNPNYNYITKRNFTFEYLKKYESVDYAEELEKKDIKLKSCSLLFVVDELIQQHFFKLGYKNYIHYFRYLFNKEGIYPQGLYEVLLGKYTRSRKMKEKKVDNEKDVLYKNVSISVSKFEYDHIIKPFLEYLNKKDLTLSQLVRYELVKHGLLDFDEAHIAKKVVGKAKGLKYKAKNTLKENREYKAKQKNEKGRLIVAVAMVNKPGLLELMKGNFGTWIKHFVLKKYGAYPKTGVGRDASSAFINRLKLSNIIKKIEDYENDK